MNKFLSSFFFIVFFFNVNLFGQIMKLKDIPEEILSQINYMGMDDCSLLIENESRFLDIDLILFMINFPLFVNSVGTFMYTGGKTGAKTIGVRPILYSYFLLNN